MTFAEALVVLNRGLKVRRNGVDNIYLDDGSLRYVESDDLVDLQMEDYLATDWEQVREELRPLGENEVFMVFDTQSNRWKSTTNPQRHRDAGARVAVFALDEVV